MDHDAHDEANAGTHDERSACPGGSRHARTFTLRWPIDRFACPDARSGRVTGAATARGGPIDGLVIVHEDTRILVVDKPSGLLSQPGRTVSDSVVERVRAARPEASGPLMMHRLDMDTSGLLVLAKDAAAHRQLSLQFERREIGKTYRARLAGPAPALGGRIALPLRLDVENRPMQIVCTELGRKAVTLWRRVPGGAPGDVVFHPLSGRTHQLRVHAADPRGLGVPIVGDRLYGTAGPRLMLHAERLTLTHPATGERQTFSAAVPYDEAGDAFAASSPVAPAVSPASSDQEHHS